MTRLIILTICWQSLFASLPTSICFLTMDLKYNDDDGVKVCELQSGLGSLHRPGEQLEDNAQIYAQRLCDIIERYQDQVWYDAANIPDQFYLDEFACRGWTPVDAEATLLDDPLFTELAECEVQDPARLDAYHGLLLFHLKRTRSAPGFAAPHPGMLFMDEPLLPMLGTKARTSQLFESDRRLAALRPDWKLYPKSISDELLDQILEEMPYDMFVIKPSAGARGEGIIMCERRFLKGRLKLLLGDKKRLRRAIDPDIRYWARDKSPTFILEEFVPSLNIPVEHLGMQVFDPTARVSFVIICQEEKIDIECVAAFWKLPAKPLRAYSVPLTHRHITKAATTRFAPMHSDTRDKILTQLQELLPLLFELAVSPEA